ncbi:MAG: hypothetical protein Q4C55_05615 [Eubacterium sp.]|nr:hypothetical protein [Eubacterium sp.]
MIDTSKKLRSLIKEQPSFGEFLIEKGFPINLNNPVMRVVSFDDVARRKNLDKEAFIKEYEVWVKKR